MGLYNTAEEVGHALKLLDYVQTSDFEQDLQRHLEEDCPDCLHDTEKASMIADALKVGIWGDDEVWEQVQTMPAVTELNLQRDDWRGSSRIVSACFEQRGRVKIVF